MRVNFFKTMMKEPKAYELLRLWFLLEQSQSPPLFCYYEHGSETKFKRINLQLIYDLWQQGNNFENSGKTQ